MTTDTIQIDIEQFVDFDSLEDNVLRLLADRVEAKQLHAESFHKIATQAINDGVRRIVEGKVTEMLNKPIPMTDRYGEVTGDPKSFKDMLADAVEIAMTETVDHDGKPKKQNAYDRDCFTRTEWAIRKATGNELTKAIDAEIKKVSRAANDAIKDKMAAMLAKHFSVK